MLNLGDALSLIFIKRVKYFNLNENTSIFLEVNSLASDFF